MDQMLMDVMRIVGFNGDFPLNDRVYGRGTESDQFSFKENPPAHLPPPQAA